MGYSLTPWINMEDSQKWVVNKKYIRCGVKVKVKNNKQLTYKNCFIKVLISYYYPKTLLVNWIKTYRNKYSMYLKVVSHVKT